MKIRTLLLLVGLAAVAAFAALNWGAFTTPTTLSLAFGVVEAPLGLVMLGLTAFLTALFLLVAVFIQTSALLDARRHERELQSMRELAERAEASRFTKLQELIEGAAGRVADAGKESKEDLAARLERLEAALKSSIEQSGNSLAAYMGEIDEKIDRAIAGQ